MKYLKMLALAAIACTALMAFANTASATTLKAAGVPIKTGAEISASLKAKTSTVFEDTFGISQNTCTVSTVKGKTSNLTGTTVTGNIETLTFEGCTRTTKTLKPGTLHIAWTSGRDGTVTGSGSEVETGTPTGVCVYGTGAGTHLGTLKGVATTTEHASLVVNAILPLIRVVSGSCVSDARWTAEYTVTSPTGLTVSS